MTPDSLQHPQEVCAMPKVEFGPLYTTMEKYIGPVEFAEKAESWGYDYYWVPDYVTLSPMDAFVLLSAVGQRTTSIKLGTAVVVVPFRTPFQLAKASATVDVLSGGRFTLGVGIGGAVPRDFDVAQVDMRKRGRISNETLHITRRLLTEENVSHRGHYYSFDDLTIEPRPVSDSGIPIWIGSICNNGFPAGSRGSGGPVRRRLLPHRHPNRRIQEGPGADPGQGGRVGSGPGLHPVGAAGLDLWW